MRKAISVLVIAFVLVIGLGLVVVSILRARQAGLAMGYKNNLKQIGIALHNYHDVYSAFPRGIVFHPSLPPEKCLSWYVALLPFVEQHELFKQLDMSRGWDEEANLRAMRSDVVLYSGYYMPHGEKPVHPPLAVGVAGLGPEAARLPRDDPRAGFLGYERSTKIGDLTGRLSETLVVIETPVALGPWVAGGPATVRGLDPEQPPYLGPKGQFGSPWCYPTTYAVPGVPHLTNALCADGSVLQLAPSLEPKVFEAMCVLSAGPFSEGEQPPDIKKTRAKQ